MFDKILSNGWVYDGTGCEAYRADIGISSGKIAAIGNLAEVQAAQRVDLEGLAISPGFIDLHTHSDFTLMVNGCAESQVHQGVTTEVVGQCGFSCAPLRDADDISPLSLGFHLDEKKRKRWQSFGDYLDILEDTPLGVNVAALVGHGTIHRAVLGDALQAGEPEDIARMKKLVEDSLDDGAAGFSTGLEYWPGLLATPEHLVSLCRSWKALCHART